MKQTTTIDALSFIASYRQHDLACDTKSAVADRKNRMQNYFISNLFTICQLKSQIHMVSIHNIDNILILIFSHGTCIISQILKYLKLRIIFDMYNACTLEGKWD